MSAVTTAKRLSRRSLERQGMTPEEELELLIAEQQADDTHIIRKPLNELSLDAPAPGGLGLVSDFIGVDEDGEIISFLPREEGLIAGSKIPHGTRGGYTNYRCRCNPCRSANAEYVRARRAGGAS